MKWLAAWGKNVKGLFYGLKLHLSSDFKRKVLALRFTSGNRADAGVFMELNADLDGVFVADAGYTGEQLACDFHIENKRWLLVKS